MENYYLPVLFTETERENYAKWGMKKEKFLIPYAIIVILIDLFVGAETILFLSNKALDIPYFSIWSSHWGSLIMKVSSLLALVLTILFLKPLDILLNYIYKKPQNPATIRLTPTMEGVNYAILHDKEESACGLIDWTKWDTAILPASNELIIQNKKYKIGTNTIKTIYPQDKQKPWLDRPDERVRNSINLTVIDQNFKGFLASLEEKKKEEEWIKQNLV